MKMALFKIVFKVGFLIAFMMIVPYYMLSGGSMPDFLKDIIGDKTEKTTLPGNLSSVTTDKQVTVYKCRDKSGQIQFSDSPCGEGETIHLRPNTNVVQAVKVPEKEEEESGSSLISLGGGSKKDKDGKAELPNPYSPEGVQQIIKDAQKAADMMNQRNQEVEKVMGNY